MSVSAAAPNLLYSAIVHIICFGNYLQFLELQLDRLILFFFKCTPKIYKAIAS